jgi:TIR domain
VGSLNPIDYYSCFISYSSKDQAFAERLYADLQSKSVRCWYAPHDMRIGDEIRPRIDESIRIHDKLLLVLSESSLASTWVKKEVETAFEKETQRNTLVLFPIRLDEMVMHTQEAWAADIRRMRHIGDFRQWKDHDEYQNAFARLLRDLQAQ